jgi:hypothetical protein
MIPAADNVLERSQAPQSIASVRPEGWQTAVGAQDEPWGDVCEPVAVNVSPLAAIVSPRTRIVSRNVSPRKLKFASRADYVCRPQQ